MFEITSVSISAFANAIAPPESIWTFCLDTTSLFALISSVESGEAPVVIRCTLAPAPMDAFVRLCLMSTVAPPAGRLARPPDADFTLNAPPAAKSFKVRFCASMVRLAAYSRMLSPRCASTSLTTVCFMFAPLPPASEA